MNNLLKNEISQRLKKLQCAIVEAQADACVITSSVNQYYLCNRVFDGYLYVFPEGEPILFVKRPVGIMDENAIYIRKPEQIPDFLAKLPKRILTENDVLSYNSAIRLQAALGMPETTNVSAKMREIRALKSEYELEQIRECAKIHSRVYEQIPSLYRAGMTDVELQIEIEHEMRLHGSMGIFRAFGENMEIFMGSILAGDNAGAASPFDFALGGKGVTPLLPIGANGTPLAPGTTLMIDMAGNFRPLMSDMTRTFAIGMVARKAYDAHQVSIEMHQWLSENVRAGVSCADIYNYSLETAKRYGLESCFMGTAQQAKFVGHGVGLEINEPPVLAPRSKDILQAGMVIAVEPKFVLPEIGGVGIENTYIVSENGFEKVTICEEKLIVL